MNLASTINQMKRIMKYQAENTVSSFFYYMWNAWSEEECKAVYGGCTRISGKNGAWRQARAHSRGGTVLPGTLGRQPQDSGGTGRLDI